MIIEIGDLVKDNNDLHELVEVGKNLPIVIIQVTKKDLRNYFPNQTSIPAHWHRSLEIAYLENCVVTLNVGDKKFNIENSFTLINSKEVHSLVGKEIKDDANCIILLISYDCIKGLYPDYDQVNFSIIKLNENKKEFKVIVDLLMDSYLSNDEYKHILCNSYLLQILHFLFSKCICSEQMLIKQRKKEAMAMLDFMHVSFI